MKKVLAAAAFLVLTLSAAGCSTNGQNGDAGGQPSTTPSAAAFLAPAGWGGPSTWVLPPFDPSGFVAGVSNPYWPLAPGTRWSYEARTGEGTETIEVVVLPQTRDVMGVTCTVVRDTVKLDGELVEDTFDWYAQDASGNVWYMGEDTKEYEGGEVVSTAGSWEAGVGGAEPGIKVWAAPRIGGPAYYQEFYEGEAEDLGKDLDLSGEAQTPDGSYRDLLVVEEWTPLDPGFVERKYYAKGVGVVMEEMVRGGDEVVLLTAFVP
jgi:hypothetical protein